MVVERDRMEYDTWAGLYDLTMGSTYGESQLKILERILLPELPERCRLLDLCCGTGQLAVSLSLKGYQVTGIDSSVQMLKYARKNSRYQGSLARFVLGDARDFSLNNPVNAVISTSASLNHIMSLDELKNVFLQVNRSLIDGGAFFFDINHHGQMQKWWNNQMAEGEIKSNYAWGIIPNYNSESRKGAFKVITYNSTESRGSNLKQNFKNIVYKILGRQRLTRLRLKVLSNFGAWQPDWKYDEVNYPVRGHRIEEVRQALTATGFDKIFITTVDDMELNNDRSAYFLAYKA